MKDINKDVRDMIVWFNKLDEKNKEKILKHVEINSIFKLQDDELEHIKVFINYAIQASMLQEDKDDVVEKLYKAGLEKESTRKLLHSIDRYSNIINDSKLIIKIESDRFEKLVKFIIDKVIIYREFSYIPFSEFVEEFNFHNKKEASDVLRYIHYNISLISSRKISLDTSKKMLTRQYDIPEEICDIFYKEVNDSITELREAYLFQNLDNIGTMMKKMSDNNINENKW